MQNYSIVNSNLPTILISLSNILILFIISFGYHFYKNNKDVVTLMKLFNHRDPSITLRYIGIERDEMSKAVKKWGGL